MVAIDATNAGTPAAGGQLSGEASRQAAIRRLQKLGQRQSSGPNTGATGLPKPERSLVQLPGAINQSSTPERKH
jgi:hypothetical protein